MTSSSSVPPITTSILSTSTASSFVVSLVSVSNTPSSNGMASTTEINKVSSETASFDGRSIATQIDQSTQVDQSTVVVLAVVPAVGSIICCLAILCFVGRKNRKERRNSDIKGHHSLDYKTDATTDVTQEVA